MNSAPSASVLPEEGQSAEQGAEPQIEMKDFIKIFEKDSFSEKAINLIKAECKEEVLR